MVSDVLDPCSNLPFTDLSLLSFHIPYHIGKAFKKKKKLLISRNAIFTSKNSYGNEFMNINEVFPLFSVSTSQRWRKNIHAQKRLLFYLFVLSMKHENYIMAGFIYLFLLIKKK